MSASYPITFIATASQTAESMGSGCSSSDAIVGFSILCDNASFLPHQSFSAFFGASVTGDWTLNISDRAGGDNGRLESWTLNADVTAVPEPASLALLGLGLGALGLTRRKRM